MNQDDLLACPACHSENMTRRVDDFRCSSCGDSFEIVDGVAVFLRSNSGIRHENESRAEFWNAGWNARNSGYLKLNADGVRQQRETFLAAMRGQGYPSVVDIGPNNVADKIFLNIGCGGGDEGLLFSGYGTNYIGVDFSYHAAKFTQTLIQKAGFRGTAYQAEAEHLPFRDDSVEYIYSNGVLHHTPDTLGALREVWRVLAPGGTAMIGLYATRSITFYWYRLHAILRGNLSRHSIEKWLDANTEGEWKTDGRVNQWTRTYTARQFADLLEQAGFRNFRIRQTPIQLKHVPLVGKVAKQFLPASIGEMQIGRLGMILMATCTKQSANQS